jgi:hypothetical protein
MISGNAHYSVSPWLVAAIPLLGSWLVVRSLEIVKLVDFFANSEVREGEQKKCAGESAGESAGAGAGEDVP